MVDNRDPLPFVTRPDPSDPSFDKAVAEARELAMKIQASVVIFTQRPAPPPTVTAEPANCDLIFSLVPTPSDKPTFFTVYRRRLLP